MGILNAIKSCIFLIFGLIVNLNAFAVPTKITPKISIFVRGWDQGNVGSCHSFAVANSIENHYAQQNYYGVTIAPWHFYYYEKQNLDSKALVGYKLSQAYTPKTVNILKQFGQLVPSLFLPEGGQGLDTKQDGNGWLPPIEVFGKYPLVADTPMSYTAETHFMEDYFLSGESQAMGINRLQRLIASGEILTLGLNGDYLDDEFNSTFGVLKIESEGIGSGKFSDITHSVALVGYDSVGIIIKNSWNSLSRYNHERSIWESFSI